MYHMFAASPAKLLAALGFVMALAAMQPACASELVMFFRGGCVWCERWDRDIGSVYDKTEEAQRLPLRRVDIMTDRVGGIALREPVRFTPTFVIVDDGHEVGRITGYAGEDTFWGLLDSIAAKIKPSAPTNRI